MFQVGNLQSDEGKSSFQINIQSRLEDPCLPTDPSPEMLWEHLKTTMLKASEEVLGFSTKKNIDWFDENNQDFLAEKRSAH